MQTNYRRERQMVGSKADDWWRPAAAAWSNTCVQNFQSTGSKWTVELKRKWRQAQISSHQKLYRNVDSSWRRMQTDSWCGWLLKHGRSPLGSWKCRWFELRPSNSHTGCTEPSVPLHYYHSLKKSNRTETNILMVTSIRRRPEYDSPFGFVLSVKVLG